MSVLVFLCVVAAQEELQVPAFLITDFMSLSGLYEAKSGPMDRAVSVLRVSTKEALTSRMPDPFMLDHLLLHSGLGIHTKADEFVKRYNNCVFYDKALMLQDPYWLALSIPAPQ